MNNETNAAHRRRARAVRLPQTIIVALGSIGVPRQDINRKFCSTGQGNTTVVTKTSFAEIALKHGTFILKLPETPFNGERATSHGEAESIFKSSSRW